MPAINPQVLKWARETAGFSLEDAARLLTFKDTLKRTAAERLLALETGKEEPTRRILELMSQKYRRSLLVFYLNEPPTKGDRGRDFRMLPGQSLSDDPHLDALIRDLKTRQSLVKSLLEDEETQPLSFVGSANMQQGEQAVAESIIATLDFKLSDFRASRSVNDAFAYLRRRIESKGIFVLLAGDLGSYRTAINTEIFRGFAIADPIAPFVVINNRDAPVAWAFTALHEVAHLWLGETGVSGASISLEIERFCNEVAGRILLPVEELNELQEIWFATLDEAVSQVSEFARSRNISRAMVAFSLLHSGKINQTRWQELTNQFNKEWEDSKEKKKEKKEEQKGGPNYYVVHRHRLGAAIMDLVGRSMSEGALSPTKAAKILGVKPRKVSALLNPKQPGGRL
jgi:Zn-dependent peptidase ImmA (M78 family)